MASAFSGCQQCHGSKVALQSTDGGSITVDDLQPDENGQPTNLDAVAKIVKDPTGKPLFTSGTWPNTGIGRLNLDGSAGRARPATAATTSRRVGASAGELRQVPPRSGPSAEGDLRGVEARRRLPRPQRRHEPRRQGLGAGRGLRRGAHLRHLPHVGHSRNGGDVTHDPAQRISWTNRPPVSALLDTDVPRRIVTATDPAERQQLIADTWQAKRTRMQAVCSHCHTPAYVNAFYQQYDDLVILYNEKFAKPGKAIMGALADRSSDHDPVRRRDRVDLVLPLAPRGPPRPPRRVDDGARLHPLARHVRSRRALLHGADPAGPRAGRGRRAPEAPRRRADRRDPRPSRARLVRGGRDGADGRDPSPHGRALRPGTSGCQADRLPEEV